MPLLILRQLKKRNTLQCLLVILGIGFLLRFYQLDDLPAEIYGDILLVYDWVNSILSGRGLPAFTLSVGPIYFYLLAPFIKIFGDSYLVLKSFSSLIGIITIFSTYFLARTITDNKYIALLASFFLTISKWHIIFSRIGHQIIIVPLFSSLAYIFLVKSLKDKSLNYLIFTGIISGLALYTYIPAWMIPVALFTTLLIQVRKYHFRMRKSLFSIILFLFLVVLISIPLVKTITSDRTNFFGKGYIGNKIFVTIDQRNKFTNWLDNVKKTLLMFHIHGDELYRHNPPGEPQIDRLTGIFFLLGIISLILLERNKMIFTITPIIFFLIPATLVVNFPDEAPSASRTIAVVPFVSITAGFGVYYFVIFLKRFFNIIIIGFVLSISLILILLLNIRSYFDLYRYNLPNHNISNSRIIASFIDQFPENVALYFSHCCITDLGRPDTRIISYNLKKSREYVHKDVIASCEEIKQMPALILINKDKQDLVDQFSSCLPNTQILKVKGVDNTTLAYMIYIF